ncbi:unnamed protein product [Spirodela intermedia]|uniref:UBC core domain-containing protein n=1 Tax=Spirodela intermedia TaxID=51605 RepID=A0A7I8KMS4_SPIIN|nr:unnamed protein product [Spirodela intermedia]
MAEEKYNLKNPAVKRILQEVKEMQANPSDDFMSLPLEENIFEWQFAIRGPRDSEFEGGIYHGRIQLPAEYPFKPPSFMLLTPNGRFETQTKICLSISNHHPEHWQPSWSVRTALVALIAFMPTNPDGALGSLDYKKEERRALAIKSRGGAPRYGTPERQRLIDEIHEYMLNKSPPVPTPVSAPALDQQPIQRHEEEAPADPPAAEVVAAAGETTANNAQPEQRIVEEVREVRVNAGAGRVRVSFSAGVRFKRRVAANADPAATAPKPVVDERWFTYAAVGLTIAIVALLMKKFLKVNGLAGYPESL